MSSLHPDSDVDTGYEVPGAPEEGVLEIDEIQGNVLPGFNTSYQTLIGLKIEQVAPAKEWLKQLTPYVSTLREVVTFRNLRRALLRRQGGQTLELSSTWISVAFSIGGLRKLTPEADAIQDRAFVGGMAARSGRLGDPRSAQSEGNKANWIVGGSEATTPDLLLIVAANDRAHVAAAIERLRNSVTGLPASGLRIIYEQSGQVLEGDREHFGFRDGVSQPGVRGRLSEHRLHFLTRRYVEPSEALALTHSKPGQPLVWPGQYVFGYPGQLSSDPLTPGPVVEGGPAWMRNGSLLVFRRLRQDVAAFRRFVAEKAAELAATQGFAGMTPERLAALITGRWPSGTSLMRSPHADASHRVEDHLAINHFNFQEIAAPVKVTPNIGEAARTVGCAPSDFEGLICPRFAHIRKVNPRDLDTDQGSAPRTLTFQVMRRGITWGDELPSGEEANDPANGQRGLLFLCYQTSIEQQFEVLNSKWMNREIGPQSGGHDMLVGQNNETAGAARRCVIKSGNDEATLEAMSHWVIPTGGGYFFAPSISALRDVLAA